MVSWGLCVIVVYIMDSYTGMELSIMVAFSMDMYRNKKCVRYQVPNIVNSTAINIIEKNHTHSLKVFTGYIKLITVQLYQENCHMENCYICSRS